MQLAIESQDTEFRLESHQHEITQQLNGHHDENSHGILGFSLLNLNLNLIYGWMKIAQSTLNLLQLYRNYKSTFTLYVIFLNSEEDRVILTVMYGFAALVYKKLITLQKGLTEEVSKKWNHLEKKDPYKLRMFIKSFNEAKKIV